MGEVHHYSIQCSWSGSTAGGFEAYDREHSLSAPPAAPRLSLTSDPAFRGDPSLLNPEQLVVMAASSCQLLSFLAVASRARVDVVAYEDEAAGEMPDDVRPVRLTRILLRPRITLGAHAEEDRVQHLVEVAHRHCFIANSLLTEVEIDATVVQPV